MEFPKPLVSIIVPVYGTEKYLQICIESILKQSYSDIQVVLVDDQSPDRCPQICDEYAERDSRVVVVHQENKGVSGARNTGLVHSIGDYVMFVDSDDELHLDAVKILLEDALEYKADIVSANQKIVGENCDIISSFEDGSYKFIMGEDALLLSLDGDESTVSACAKLFRAAFIKDIYFEEGKNIHEDGFFVFQCYAKRPRLVHHNILLYTYNIRNGSNSKQHFSEKYLSMLYYCERKKVFISKHYPQYVKHAYNMEIRTNLQLLDLLCSTTEKKYRQIQLECENTVRKLQNYHTPINKHHKKLAWIVAHRLYSIYRIAVRLKYYR